MRKYWETPSFSYLFHLVWLDYVGLSFTMAMSISAVGRFRAVAVDPKMWTCTWQGKRMAPAKLVKFRNVNWNVPVQTHPPNLLLKGFIWFHSLLICPKHSQTIAQLPCFKAGVADPTTSSQPCGSQQTQNNWQKIINGHYMIYMYQKHSKTWFAGEFPITLW